MSHRKSAKKKRDEVRNPPEADPEFQIAPMIDILLVLLVFFMSISSTETLRNNQDIALPVAKDAKAPKKTAEGQVVINVFWGAINNLGSIEVDDKQYPTPSDLVPMLKKHLLVSPQTRLLVRADRAVRYEYLRQVLRAAGEAGVSNITFSVVDKDVPK